MTNFPANDIPPKEARTTRPAETARRGSRRYLAIGALIAVAAVVAILYVGSIANHPDNPAADVSPAEVQNADPSTDVAPEPATPPAGQTTTP